MNHSRSLSRQESPSGDIRLRVALLSSWRLGSLAPVPHLHHPPTIHVFQAIRAAVTAGWWSVRLPRGRVCAGLTAAPGSRAASSGESLHPPSGRSHSWNERWGAGCRVPLGFSPRSWVHSASAVVHLPQPGPVSPAEAPGPDVGSCPGRVGTPKPAPTDSVDQLPLDSCSALSRWSFFGKLGGCKNVPFLVRLY